MLCLRCRKNKAVKTYCRECLKIICKPVVSLKRSMIYWSTLGEEG